MKVYREISLEDFDAWSGGEDTKNEILAAGKGGDFDALIEDMYPGGIDETDLNDILWFEGDWIRESLGMNDDEDDEDEDNDEDDEDDNDEDEDGEA